jgi:hypothetical protein
LQQQNQPTGRINSGEAIKTRDFSEPCVFPDKSRKVKVRLRFSGFFYKQNAEKAVFRHFYPYLRNAQIPSKTHAI